SARANDSTLAPPARKPNRSGAIMMDRGPFRARDPAPVLQSRDRSTVRCILRAGTKAPFGGAFRRRAGVAATEALVPRRDLPCAVRPPRYAHTPARCARPPPTGD